MAITGTDLESIVKQDLKEEFHNMLYNNCTKKELKPGNDTDFISRKCCSICISLDKMCPGLFKIEHEADQMICLSSKCYIAATLKIVKKLQSNTLIQKIANKLKRKYLGVNSRCHNMLNKKQKLGQIHYTIKLSTKGIKKNTIKTPLCTFKQVLHDKKSKSSINTGFIYRDNKMLTYQQVRYGINFFYCKREVAHNLRSTSVLKFTMVPIERV